MRAALLMRSRAILNALWLLMPALLSAVIEQDDQGRGGQHDHGYGQLEIGKFHDDSIVGMVESHTNRLAVSNPPVRSRGEC